MELSLHSSIDIWFWMSAIGTTLLELKHLFSISSSPVFNALLETSICKENYFFITSQISRYFFRRGTPANIYQNCPIHQGGHLISWFFNKLTFSPRRSSLVALLSSCFFRPIFIVSNSVFDDIVWISICRNVNRTWDLIKISK